METYQTPKRGLVGNPHLTHSWWRLGRGDVLVFEEGITLDEAGGIFFRFDVDVLDRFGGSGLHWAASGGHLEVGRVDRNLDVWVELSTNFG